MGELVGNHRPDPAVVDEVASTLRGQHTFRKMSCPDLINCPDLSFVGDFVWSPNYIGYLYAEIIGNKIDLMAALQIDQIWADDYLLLLPTLVIYQKGSMRIITRKAVSRMLWKTLAILADGTQCTLFMPWPCKAHRQIRIDTTLPAKSSRGLQRYQFLCDYSVCGTVDGAFTWVKKGGCRIPAGKTIWLKLGE